MPRLRQVLLLAAFLVSGATGLVYELVWTRAASTWFGVSTYAISTILAAFLVGLALGGRLGGRWVDRHPDGRPLRAYAAAEVGVGISALLLQALIERADPAMIAVARAFPGFTTAGIAVRFLVAAPLLLLPTMLMGATFPLFAHGLVQHTRTVQRGVSLAYGINVLGAAAGCAGTAFVLLSGLGAHRAVLLAAGLNLVVAAVAWTLDRRGPGVAAEPEPDIEPAPTSRARLLWLVALSGLAAMALEVVWSRVYSQALGLLNPYRAFAVVLALILLGMGLGSLVLARADLAAPLRTAASRLRLFGRIQLGLGALALLSLTQVRQGIVAVLGEGSVRAVNGAVLAASALLLGLGFPLLASVHARVRAAAGGRLGELYAASTVAGVLGSLLGGFVLVPLLGLRLSLLLLGGVNLATAALAGSRRPALALALALLAAAALSTDRPEYPVDGELAWYTDGVEASTAVSHVTEPESVWILYSNGHSILETISRPRTHVPVLLASRHERILLIGFGTGGSAGALLDDFPSATIDCVELDGNQVGAARFFGTERVLTDPRFTLHIEDGRQFMLRSPGAYDVIIVDSWGQSINQEFYNADFFSDAQAALTEGGVFWVKLPSGSMTGPEEVDVVLRSAAVGFNHAWLMNDRKLFPGIIGSRSPLDLGPMSDPGLSPELRRIRERARRGMRPIDADVLGRMRTVRINSDDRPWFFSEQGRAQGLVDDYVDGLVGNRPTPGRGPR